MIKSTTTGACSCGSAKLHVVARRSTADGKHVYLWDDGSLTWALGYAIRGAWMRPSEANRGRAMKAGWLTLGEVEVYDADEVTALVRAARFAADRDGLPGTLRARLHAAKPVLRPEWQTLRADRDGKPTERAWVLPGLSAWAGHAVWDYVSVGASRGRYEILYRITSSRDDEPSYATTGLRFGTQRDLLAFMEANPPKVEERLDVSGLAS